MSEPRPATPKDAATVVLLRDAESGFEVFLVRRHSKSGFMGGAHVFPGGKLDDADCELASRLDGPDAPRALGEDLPQERALGLYIAAARETFEEAGVLLAEEVAADALKDARRTLADGSSFESVLEGLGASLALDRLVPWSRWITPDVEPRRYDTRFFLARAPEDQTAAHDQVETTADDWLRPDEALERERAGEIQLPPPTMRSLELLAAHDSVDSAFAAAAAVTPPLVNPVFLMAEEPTLLLPGDPEHPTRERAIAGPTRLVLRDGRWWAG